ncbi:MAG: peptidoglycan DD-metalloendopeptidase family protein [Acidobacteria bacterium]|nr:peptidoglycan DD-metalloendopeptidase family protein [Acidobacteriota bacterium]
MKIPDLEKILLFLMAGAFLITSFAVFLFLNTPLPAPPPPAEVTQSPPQPRVIRFENTVVQKETVQELLSRFGFSPESIARLIKDTRPVYNLNRIGAGHHYEIERYEGGAFKSLRYDISVEQYLLVTPWGPGFQATLHQHEFEIVVEEIFGRIDGSLYYTLVSRGERDGLVASLMNILRWDVDFTSVKSEDSFKLIVEKKYLDGNFIKYGKILAVEFRSAIKTFRGFLFEDPAGGEARYYDENGKSLRKAFLKVPFNFDPRITSHFSYSRFHPLFRRRRPHLGVDYGAPAGTPVLASADGVVEFAGFNGGYGKWVRIRHSGGLKTSYAHLSRIDVRPGRRVFQGERIGTVGSTGVATGPHLDYRVEKNGRFVDPRSVLSVPSEDGLSERHQVQFNLLRRSFEERLAAIPEDEPYLNRVSAAGGG